LTADKVITGSLAQGGFSVALDGANLVTGVSSTFTINKDTTLSIAGTKSFKGFLMRLGATDGVMTDNAFSVIANSGGTVQVSSRCTDTEGVGGVTHTSNNNKSFVSAILKLGATASLMPLDVTVVVQNSGTSEYYYTRFHLTSSVAVTAVPTKAPAITTTSAPTKKPVMIGTTPAPTKAPGVTATSFPTTKGPVITVTAAPTKAPAVATTSAPSRNPL
jgi:hypothetical protein